MESKPKVTKRGRPKIEIDLKQLERLAELFCTDEELAYGLGISVDTLTRRKSEPQFAETIEKGKAKGKTSLRRKQYQIALDGNVTMLIWLGKQHLGQVDRQEVTGTSPGSFMIVSEIPRPERAGRNARVLQPEAQPTDPNPSLLN
jgi:hypothetical protein